MCRGQVGSESTMEWWGDARWLCITHDGTVQKCICLNVVTGRALANR